MGRLYPHGWPGGLQVFRAQPRVLGNTTQNLSAQLVVVVKGKLIVGPVLAGQKLVGTSLPFNAPADTLQRSQHSAGFSLVAGHLLTHHPKRDVEGGRRQFTVPDPIGNHLDGQSLRVADGLLARLSIRHNARKFQRFSNPAAVVFPVDLYGKVHCYIVRRAVLLKCRVSLPSRPPRLRSPSRRGARNRGLVSCSPARFDIRQKRGQQSDSGENRA